MILHPLIDALAPAVRAAGALIEAVRVAGIDARHKADASPVTEADERAEALLVAAIAAADPGTLIVGEEGCAASGHPAPADRFWLVDALDGTRDFVRGGADYTVNVALIEQGRPVLGLVLAPRSGTLWAGAVGAGAVREEVGGPRNVIVTRASPATPVVLASRSHRDAATDAWIAALPAVELASRGSSLKFCLVAEGSADVYPRFGPTSEWDVAAGHALLLAAGGAMVDTDGAPFGYGKPAYLNGPFLAVGDPAALVTLPGFPKFVV